MAAARPELSREATLVPALTLRFAKGAATARSKALKLVMTGILKIAMAVAVCALLSRDISAMTRSQSAQGVPTAKLRSTRAETTATSTMAMGAAVPAISKPDLAVQALHLFVKNEETE